MVRTVDPFLPMPLTETSAMEWAYDRTTWITIIVVFLTPLCFLRQFDSLKFVRLTIGHNGTLILLVLLECLPCAILLAWLLTFI